MGALASQLQRGVDLASQLQRGVDEKKKLRLERRRSTDVDRLVRNHQIDSSAHQQARKLSTLLPTERPDLLLSLKLGLDPLSPLITEKYSFEGVLGKGHFGVVECVEHRSSGRQYACKLVKTQHLNINSVKAEMQILQACRHPNIISVKEMYATEDIVYFVMELARGGLSPYLP